MPEGSLYEVAPPFAETRSRPGRPPEDRFLRQLEIFAAVAPLIAEQGARELTMRRAARAAHMSVGGVYRYFASKRDLLLFPLTAECCAEQMRRFEQAHGFLRRRDPRAYVETFFDEIIATLPFVRAGMRAAVELGADEFWRAMDDALDEELEERFVALAHAGAPGGDRVRERARAARRAFVGAILDSGVGPEELRAQLVATIDGLAPAASGDGLAPAASGDGLVGRASTGDA